MHEYALHETDYKRFGKPVYATEKDIEKRKIKKIKKINYFSLLLLVVLFFTVCLPVCKGMYNYLFLYKAKNSKLKYNHESFINKTPSLLANARMLDRNILAPPELKKTLMAQMELNTQMPRLQKSLENLSALYPNLQPGIFVYDFQTKNYVSIAGDKQMATASIIKVPILVQMFRRIEDGQISLYDEFQMTPYYRTGGSGHLQFKADKTRFDMDFLAKMMIRESDNSATNMILSAIGGADEFNSAMRRWGLKSTYIKNWLPDLYGENTTTPRDMATILYNADNPEFLNLESRSKIIEIMSKVKNRSLLKQGIPDSAQLVHKTGDIGEMLGDTGIVTMPDGRRYIVVVMVKRRWNDYSARTFVNQASSVIYNSFAINSL